MIKHLLKISSNILIICLFFIQNVSAQQICDSDKPRSTLIDNFQLTSSGFVIQNYYDNESKQRKKRYWMACSVGQIWTGLDCEDSRQELNFKKATERVNSIRFAGFEDWKIPSVEEFRSIIEWQCKSPAVDQLFFPGIDFYSYWTRDKSKKNKDLVWVIDFLTGEAMYAHTSQKNYIIALREERTSLAQINRNLSQ